MTDTLPPPTDTVAAPAKRAAAQPAPALDRAGWLEMMDKQAEDSGHFEALGPKHWAFFADESPTLIVTFEQLDEIRQRPGQMPLGHDVAKSNGWSHLCLISEGDTWYRDKRVYGYMDRLVDDAFFEDFDHVVFMGCGVQGYAAEAFSVAAPGATVIALSPRATMDPAVASWDRRAIKARGLDFNSRYGFAPDMIEGAGQVFVLHNPDVTEDAMHAALFRGKHVTHFRLPRLPGRRDWALAHMRMIQQLVDLAVAGALNPVSFAKLWRARRNFGPYLRTLLDKTAAEGRTKLEIKVCRSVATRLQAPRFKKRLADLLAAEVEAELAAAKD
jgi:hypothetical protein